MNEKVQPVVDTVEVNNPKRLRKTMQRNNSIVRVCDRANNQAVVHTVKVEHQKAIKVNVQRKESIQRKSIR